MMFDTLIFLAAAAAASAPSAPEAASCGQAATITSPAVNPAIIEMTYNAFVAVEETPELNEIVRPAIVAAPNKQPAIAIPVGPAWIS